MRRVRHFSIICSISPGEAPFYAEPWVCSMIVDSHLHSPSMLCILPLQDYLRLTGRCDATIRGKR